MDRWLSRLPRNPPSIWWCGAARRGAVRCGVARCVEQAGKHLSPHPPCYKVCPHADAPNPQDEAHGGPPVDPMRCRRRNAHVLVVWFWCTVRRTVRSRRACRRYSCVVCRIWQRCPKCCLRCSSPPPLAHSRSCPTAIIAMCSCGVCRQFHRHHRQCRSFVAIGIVIATDSELPWLMATVSRFRPVRPGSVLRRTRQDHVQQPSHGKLPQPPRGIVWRPIRAGSVLHLRRLRAQHGGAAKGLRFCAEVSKTVGERTARAEWVPVVLGRWVAGLARGEGAVARARLCARKERDTRQHRKHQHQAGNVQRNRMSQHASALRAFVSS